MMSGRRSITIAPPADPVMDLNRRPVSPFANLEPFPTPKGGRHALKIVISDQSLFYRLSSIVLRLSFIMSREEELKQQGWEKRFTMDEARLSDMAEQYKELGFEVLVEPVDLASEECTSCLAGTPQRYKTLYTRLKK